MLTFNQLLTSHKLDPTGVRLLRHRHASRHGDVFIAAMEAKPEFDRYQETQSNAKVAAQFQGARWLAGFVVEPLSGATLFAGLWEVNGKRPTPHANDGFGATVDANPNWLSFRTTRVDALDQYRGRLAVDWGSGTRVWVQRADSQDKPITELRRVRQDIAFPGFGDVSLSLDQASSLPPTWQEPLRHARGVYLLVHGATGQQYVGSASGEGGFLGRWQSYSDGHGGNVGMKELGAAAATYRASILEVVASNATAEEILGRETVWKMKLGSRVKGLNKN